MSGSEAVNAEQVAPFPLTAVDQFNLTQTDEQYHPHTWEETKQLIAENRLEIFKRWPSDLKRYMKWSSDIKAEYGSVPNYVMQRRLHWTLSALTTSKSGPLFDCDDPVPFRNSNDYAILPNDWPYGWEDGIVHLIVWLKTRLESEPIRGDLTPKARRQIEDFVQRTFIDRVKDLPGPTEKVLWFKNWVALQSVPGMDHVHILVRGVPEAIIHQWTGGKEVMH